MLYCDPGVATPVLGLKATVAHRHACPRWDVVTRGNDRLLRSALAAHYL